MAVTGVLKERLKEQYEVVVVNIITEIWEDFDPIPKLTFGHCTAEDLYNYFLRNSWHRAINFLDSFGEWRMEMLKEELSEVAADYLRETKPDLVISVMPIIDPYVLYAAEKNDIPFLVVNLDLNAGFYLNGVHKPEYKKFYFTLPFDHPLLYEKIAFADLPATCIKPIGVPLRYSFFKPHNKQQIKKEFNIPKNVPTIMIMMGAQGSRLSYEYVKALAKSKDRMHLVVCIGHNETQRKRIEKIKLPSNVTMTIVGFTDKIADLMSVSDLLITKPGSNSVCEALHMQIPLLLSCIGGNVIRWEQTNVEFIIANQLGDAIIRIKDVRCLVHEWLTDKELRKTFKKNVQKFNQNNFYKSFDRLVVELLS
jgi:processive 1,2-diacylglycerol beta-glucosyltransferase